MSDEKFSNEENTAVENVILEEKTTVEPVEEVKVEEDVKVEEAKVEEPAKPVENVIETPKPKTTPGLAPVENGAIGSTRVVKPVVAPKEEPAKASDKVAIHSTKNVTWNGVGKVYRGINLVSKDAAAKWLERSHVRTATPEEVAKEYGL